MGSIKVGMSKVIFGLYVGNYRDSKDLAQLNQNGITHIIAIHDTARRHFTNKQYLLIPASDDPSTNITQYFQMCNDFIHRARLEGGKVLIHCLAGMSRSVTVAVAYIMSVTNLGMNEAIKAVQGARPVANPNEGFQRQLHDFEFIRLKRERRRLSEKFGEIGRLKAPDDESQCLHLVLMQRQVSKDFLNCSGQCLTPSRCPTGICRSKLSLFKRKPSSSKLTKMHSSRNGSESHLKFYKQSNSTSRRVQDPEDRRKKTRILTDNCNSDSDFKVNVYSSIQHGIKRRWSFPANTCNTGLASANRFLSLPVLYHQIDEGKMISMTFFDISKKIQGDYLLPFPRAFPEVTQALETENGLDPLLSKEDAQIKKSISRICALHISNSVSSVIKLSKSFRSFWPGSK